LYNVLRERVFYGLKVYFTHINILFWKHQAQVFTEAPINQWYQLSTIQKKKDRSRKYILQFDRAIDNASRKIGEGDASSRKSQQVYYLLL
jgi:hypothetical protein